MWSASDLADSWEANRQYLANHTRQSLDQFVDEHPGWFGVVLATTAQTLVEAPMAIGSGFVDVLNLGKGAAEGGWGYLQDGLRFITIVAPLARGGQAVLSRILAVGQGENCTWIAATKALQITGTRPFAALSDLANAAGRPVSATGPAFIDELVAALRALGARLRLLPNPGTLADVERAVAANRNGVTLFSVEWSNPAYRGGVGHTLAAAWNAARGCVVFVDRSGNVVAGLAELERLYPGIGGATPYGTMAFIQNGLIPQASLLKGTVVSSIADAVFLELKTVFAPPPAVADKIKQGPTPQASAPSLMHMVSGGESLSKIALASYGDMFLWPLLFDANRGAIGANPDVIRPGQSLKVPPLSSFTSSQIHDAHVRGKAWRPHR
ncbi:MAG TPA: hypothetical protein VGH98_18410 [Gemmatimonadaceae bacterium]|jgi:LysM repeat protein